MQKITPHLWFDREAKEAAEFYCSLLPDSKITNITVINNIPSGDCDVVSFELAGQNFVAISAGPMFKFNPSISFFVITKDEKEIDNLWKKFSDGGKVLMELNKYDWSKKYGWVEDRFGLSWQIILAEGDIKQEIFPSLLFVDKAFGKAGEAINYYTSVFKNAKIESVYKFPDDENAVMYSDFTLDGNLFAAMDGPGEHGFQFNEAVSFIVDCKDQTEVDYFWNKFTSDGGQESMCGWLKDKFGVSWQITPKILVDMLNDKDAAKAKRAMLAMLQMKKIIISDLEKAYNSN